MTTAKTLLLGVAACTLAFAPAAFAAPYDAPGAGVDTAAVATPQGDWTLKEREDWLSNRLDHARDDGSINDHEFDRVHDELGSIKDDEGKLRDNHDGQLTDGENNALESRLDGVADQIHWLHEDQFRKPW